MSNSQHVKPKRYMFRTHLKSRHQDGSIYVDSFNNSDQVVNHVVGGVGVDSPNWRSKIHVHRDATYPYTALWLKFDMDFGVIYETQNLVIGPGDTGKVTSSV